MRLLLKEYGGVYEHFDLGKRLAIVETKLDAISKMMWIVIAGILALVLKAYFIAG